MSKLTTAEEYLYANVQAYNKGGSTIHYYKRKDVVFAMEEYTNLRTQALREENDKLKRENDELHSKFNKWHDYDI